ncbi:MAG TPA: hypothetical protein VGG30_04505 [Pirellulales bacterium]
MLVDQGVNDGGGGKESGGKAAVTTGELRQRPAGNDYGTDVGEFKIAASVLKACGVMCARKKRPAQVWLSLGGSILLQLGCGLAGPSLA